MPKKSNKKEKIMNKNKEEKISHKQKKLRKNIIFLLIFLIAVFICLVFIQSEILDKIKTALKKPQLFVIKDECAIITNQLIHQIKNEGECKARCRNECTLRDASFNRFEFIESSNSCHNCYCYCRL